MPLLEQINGNDIVIKRLRDCPEYAEDFIYSITNAIDKAYDEITTSFAENLIRIDKNGFDEYGFFLWEKIYGWFLTKKRVTVLSFIGL